MIKGIIFDYGGVLVNETDAPAYRKMSKLFNVGYSEVQTAIDESLPDLQVGKISNREFCRRIASRLKVDIPIERWEDFWIDSYKGSLKADRRAGPLIARLKSANYRLGILSNTEPAHAEFNRKRGAFKHFDAVVLSCEAGFRKPDIRAYRMVLEKIGLRPDECVFIDDKEEYLAPAESIGIRTILFRSTPQLEADLKKMGVDF